MKKVSLWVSISLLTFFVGVACVSIWLLNYRPGAQGEITPIIEQPARSESELPELPICQVVAKPEEYEGKVIRVRAVYAFGIHGATIGSKSCLSEETGTWVSVTPAMWDEIKQATEKAYGAKNAGPLDMVAVGRFERNNPSHMSDTWADRLPFRFELLRIEKAERVY